MVYWIFGKVWKYFCLLIKNKIMNFVCKLLLEKNLNLILYKLKFILLMKFYYVDEKKFIMVYKVLIV